jgi:phosphoserine phosphatase RsbU/P
MALVERIEAKLPNPLEVVRFVAQSESAIGFQSPHRQFLAGSQANPVAHGEILKFGENTVRTRAIHYEPLGVVSGDYCDLMATENGAEGVLFLLGDVSGKGVAASLLMTHLHAMFRSLASVGLPLAEMMARANRLLCESTAAGQFATLVCGRVTPSGEVEISSAGHCPVLALRDGEVARFESTGMPLGMFCEGDYPSQQTKLEPGDSLFLFTDGASETRDASGGEFGVDRLAKLIGSQRTLAPEALAAACLKELRHFSLGAPKTDDLTLLVLRREN